MIVQQCQFQEILGRLTGAYELSLDTETTGLRPYQGDRLFAFSIGTGTDTYYFNFQSYPALAAGWQLQLDGLSSPAALALFSDSGRTWFLHNAKFDLANLDKAGVQLGGTIHCTQALARIEYNEHLSYSLDSCGERIGKPKDNAVEAYIQKQGLWRWVQLPGKKKREKDKDFTRVPLEIIGPYAERDASITMSLGVHQKTTLGIIAQSTPMGLPSILQVAENEKRLTKTLFEMEKVGITIDPSYCEEAAQFEESRYQEAARDFEQLSAIAFVDSGKSLSRAFEKVGEAYPRTEKGNPSFTDDVLESFTSPLARLVQTHRDAHRKANTYYRNFLFYADETNTIHPNIRQGGTATGRLSYSDPNLQNLNKEEDSTQPFLVRRAFVPRPNHFFCMIDYDQMEYRLMLDYAGEMSLISKVLAGLDVHEATAKMMGTDRTKAKMLNFMLLYGGGVLKLAKALGISESEARTLREDYFSALPAIRRLIRQIMNAAEKRGYIFNWMGRRYAFPNSSFAYKAPNYLIQGGCADIVKAAMNLLAEYLNGKKSRMLVQIHDEILFEIHDTEARIVPDLKAIMESVYPHRHIPLTCGVEHSFKSWADKVEGYPDERLSA